MSAGKFAAITAGLLARKGEAKPWQEPGKASLAWRSDIPPVVEQPFLNLHRAPPLPRQDALADAGPAKTRRCAVRMSDHDYQRLGILAVKKDSSRQQLLQDSLEQLLRGIARDCGECACLEPSACRKT